MQDRPLKCIYPVSRPHVTYHGKTEFIIIGTRQQLTKVTIGTLPVGETATTQASEVKDLGCWFDRYLKMDTHINNKSYVRPHSSSYLTLGELESFLVWNTQNF